ncbi:HNH endonuclease signature motif containing protein [Arsenicicoccus cauae]|uniref:HNH endonuclease signature motif containing protein n=1 Tax=Arsenicicoccus cauae TaxID=2663847 RepID=UPI001E2EF634|nr:HNH endonuclease signature motif containing protein [Arsenicicoccus cauae]
MTTTPLRQAPGPDAAPARRHLTPLPGIEPGGGAGVLTAGGVDQVVDRLLVLDDTATDTERVGLLAALQRLERAAQAAQLRTMLALDEHRHDQREAAGLATDRRGSAPGVAAEVGAALGCSAGAAGHRLGLARVADRELGRVAGLHARGLVSEQHVRAVAAATIGLGRDDRVTVDEEVAPHAAGCSVRELEARARAIAYELDPGAATAAHERAVADRHVSGRPVPGAMMRLSALLPLVEGVACLAALRQGAQAAKATGDARSVSQLQADLLVQRITGEAPGCMPVEVGIVMGDHTAFGTGDTAAWLPGYGPVPAPVARRLLRGQDERHHHTHHTHDSHDNHDSHDGHDRDGGGVTGPGYVPQARPGAPGDGLDGDDPAVLARAADVFLRRLYTHPDTGQLVALDARGRAFDGALRRLIVWRDGTCRAPGCDSPIRHIDHVHPWRDGGTTTADNGIGLCEAHNYAHEAPGHTTHAVHPPPDYTGWDQPPTTIHTYPDGSQHPSDPPPLIPSIWGPLGSHPRRPASSVD